MKNLYVFLDIDGVLNNQQAFQRNRETMFVLSDENLKVYQYLIDQLRQYYKVIIILSSRTEFAIFVNGIAAFYGGDQNILNYLLCFLPRTSKSIIGI